MGLPIDVAICAHDHALERSIVIPDRGDGNQSYAVESGSSQACVPPNAFLMSKDCTSLIPRPRIGKLQLAVGAGKVTVLSLQFTELAPRYEASVVGETPDGQKVIQVAQV